MAWIYPLLQHKLIYVITKPILCSPIENEVRKCEFCLLNQIEDENISTIDNIV